MATLIIIIFFLFLSALFSGAEIAFVSSNKLGIEVLKNKGTRRAGIIAGFYKNTKSFLATALVGNNIALVIFTFLLSQELAPLMGDLDSNSPLVLLLNTIIITVIILIFGEFLPKTFSRLYSNGFLYTMAYPLYFFKWLLAIPTWIMTFLSSLIIKFSTKNPVEKMEETLNMVDLQHFINEEVSEEDEIVDKEILTNAINLGQIKVRDCMIPRTEIVSIDIMDNIENVLAVFKESKLSRLIVLDGDIENVLGYIHHQQILDNPSDIKSIIRDISYVPEAMNVQLLMSQFINKKINIACAVDEFGGTAGIITLEDILEEIFGEIEDEHDVENNINIQLSKNEYRFSGRLEIDQINEKYENIDLPLGEYHTLSGYIVMTYGAIPETGGVIIMNNYKFILESVSNKKIDIVRVIKMI